MKSLRDANQAAKGLGQALGGVTNQRHADTIADAFTAMEHRFLAIERIVAELAKRAGVTADEIAPTSTPDGLRLRMLSPWEAEIRRILG